MTAEVVQPALAVSAGIEQLLALCEAYLDYVGRRVWPGGCFLRRSLPRSKAVPARSTIASPASNVSGWSFSPTMRARVLPLELPAAEDPEQLAAELSTVLTGADIAYLLHEDRSILDRVRVGIRARVAHSSGHGAKVKKHKTWHSKLKSHNS